MKINLQKIKQSLMLGALILGANQIQAQCLVPNPVTASPSTLCSGATTSLNATAIGNAIYWYTVPTGGSPIGSSASAANFTIVPAITTTYYAEGYISGTTTFSYTGALQNYTVPVGVTQVTINAAGAQGYTSGNPGGQGGLASGVLTVTPGQVLNIYIGGVGTTANGNFIPGGGGYNGGGNGQSNGGPGVVGGGGGASDVRVGGVALANRVIVAAGGGGSTSNTGCYGGAGGGLTGVTGGSIIGLPYLPGTGATQVAGGNDGGALGIGGSGTGTMTPWNGGGGGGYYGGGASPQHCGGGGGSSYIGGVTSGSTSTGGQTGNGSMTITVATCVSVSRTPVTVTINPSPTIAVNSGSICSGNSFTIVPSGANTYTIQGGNAVVSPTANTNYTVIGTSTAGCVSQTYATSGVTVNALPLPTVSVNSGSICSGTAFTMVPSGANSYTFQGGNAVVSPTANASYTVVGTNTAGCTSASFATSNVSVTASPSMSITGSQTICVGETTTLTVSGSATSYSWSSGPTTNSIVSSATTTTNYTVVGTSSVTGCATTTTLSLIVNLCTGVNASASKINGLSIYPNPSSGEFTIELSNGASKTIEVTDVTGKIVYTTTSSKDKVFVNITNLPNGVFYVKIQSNNASEVFSVIKQ